MTSASLPDPSRGDRRPQADSLSVSRRNTNLGFLDNKKKYKLVTRGTFPERMERSI